MIYRVKNSKYSMLGGVCAGISHKTNIALFVVRILFLICLVLQPLMLIVYLALWALLPVKTMTDNEFKAESVTFKDIPSVKVDLVVENSELEIKDSPKIQVNVVKDLEKKIDENIQKKK